MRLSTVSTSATACAVIASALLFTLARSASAQTEAPAQPSATPNPPSPPPTEAASPTATAVNTASSSSGTQATGTNAPSAGCSLETVAALHRDAPHFLVEVHARQGTNTTTGVVIEGNKVLVPYSDILSGHWPITVFFENETESPAHVVQLLKDRNLALLSVDKPPAGLLPRKFVQAAPQVGMPVISVGNALHDDKKTAWDMRTAYVSNVVGTHLEASPAAAVGAPILTCSGEIVGIELPKPADYAPIPGATNAASISAALAGKGAPNNAGYFSVGISDPYFLLALRPADTGVGFKFTWAETGWGPRFFIRSNIGAQWLTTPEQSSYANATDVFRWRFQFEGVMGLKQRFAVGSPHEGFLNIDIAPYIGAAARTDYTYLRHIGSDFKTKSQTLTEEHTDPLIGVTLEMLKIRLAYQFQLDIKAPKQSIHTLGLGWHF